ncbi:hypothetical protein [Qipengyuania flava]|uniref:hypothetical protein n=1 Tax=Qipengyuania flava TaxID=192812 RepID=UPI001C62D692|nr:hypothetical protein [Qipengyuania flava]QYJ07080.1 hypothetical protein KUV82_13755 [Qipengyuania flava]
MITIALSVLGYVGGTFLLSALLVRLAPDTFSARQIRKHLVLFPVLPLLLFMDVLAAIGVAGTAIAALFSNAFELISGRKLHRRSHDYYGYGASQRQRRSQRGHRAGRSSKRSVPTERRA